MEENKTARELFGGRGGGREEGKRRGKPVLFFISFHFISFDFFLSFSSKFSTLLFGGKQNFVWAFYVWFGGPMCFFSPYYYFGCVVLN
jgi:hypothetical protein